MKNASTNRWEQCAAEAAPPVIYAVELFAVNGRPLPNDQRPGTLEPMEDGLEREVQFMEIMHAHPEAVMYKVRALRPNEVKAALKIEEREVKRAQRRAFWSDVMKGVAERAAIDTVLYETQYPLRNY